MEKVVSAESSTSSSVKSEPEKAIVPLVNGSSSSNGVASNGDVKVNGGSADGTAVKGKESVVKKRRKRKDSLNDDDSNHQPQLGKRVRLQHQPFQSPAVKNVVPSFFRQAPASKNGDSEEKIVVFNKGDFLAVRNELNGFYVCRTAQNVYKDSRKFRIQWLNDEKDHYKPDFFDKTDFECVLTNLRLVRSGKGRYQLPEDERKRATNILQRALNVEKGVSDIPDPRQVVADGVDVSIIGKAEEMELVEIVSKIPREKSVEKEEKKVSNGKASRRPSTDVSTAKTSRSSSRRASSEMEKPPAIKSSEVKSEMKVKKSDAKVDTKAKTDTKAKVDTKAKTDTKAKVESKVKTGEKGRKKKLENLKKERNLRPRGQESSSVGSSSPPVVKKAVPKEVISPKLPKVSTAMKPAMTSKPKPRSEKGIREKRQIPINVKKGVVEKKGAEKKGAEESRKEVKKPWQKKVVSPVVKTGVTSPKKDHHRPLVECDFLADLTGIGVSCSTKDQDQVKVTSGGWSCSILSAIHGNTGQIKAMIAEGGDVNEEEVCTGNTALHLLCRVSKKSEKALETLREILKHNPNVNSINKDGRSPLHFAANSVVNEIDLTVVETLLNHGAIRRSKDKDGRIPLHYAFVKIDRDEDTTFSDPIELTIMLTKGDEESVNETDSNGQLPIHRAAQRGATFSVTHMIRCSKNKVDERDSSSNTPLSLAIRSGYENCTFSMILKGCNFGLSIVKSGLVNSSNGQKNRGHWTWIHSVNVPRVPEESSIMLEVMKRKWNRLIHLLLEMLTEVGQDLSHALIAAIKSSNLKLAIKIARRMEVNQGPFLHSLSEVSINEENKEQFIKLLDLILEKSLCDLDTLDSNQTCPLIAAAMAHNAFLCEEITKRLSMESVVSIKPDRFLRTPLTSLFYRFTTQDIDPRIQSWAGKLASGKSSLWDGPCYFAVKESIFPCLRFIHDESLFGSKYPPLIFAVIKGNFHEVKFLMTQKVDANVTDDDGRTALMHAVRLVSN